MLTDPALSEAIKGYEAGLLPLALRLEGRDGADLDDLIQEGRISVWDALRKDVTPNLDIAFARMKMWVRHLRRQNPVPYAELVRLDDIERTDAG